MFCVRLRMSEKLFFFLPLPFTPTTKSRWTEVGIEIADTTAIMYQMHRCVSIKVCNTNKFSQCVIFGCRALHHVKKPFCHILFPWLWLGSATLFWQVPTNCNPTNCSFAVSAAAGFAIDFNFLLQMILIIFGSFTLNY